MDEEKPQQPDKKGRSAWTAAGWLVVAAVIYHLWRKGSFSPDNFRLAESGLMLLAAAMIVWTAQFCLLTMRFRLLLRAAGVLSGFPFLMRITWLGQLMGQVIGDAGLDVLRAGVCVKATGRAGVRPVLAAALVDRVCGLFGLLVVGLLAVAIYRPADLPYHAVVGIGLFYFALVAGLACLFVWPYLVGKMAWLERIPGSGTLARFSAQLVLYRRTPGVLVGSLLYSMASHFVIIVILFLCENAILAKNPDFGSCMVAGSMALLAGLIPLPLGGIGVRETLYAELVSALCGAEYFQSSMSAMFLVRATFLANLAVGSLIAMAFGGIGGTAKVDKKP